MSISDSASIIQAFLDAENKKDWQIWSSFLHPNLEYELVGWGKSVRGKDPYIKHMQEVYAELPDWHFDILHIINKGNVVMVEFDGRGNFIGNYKGKKYNKVPLRLSAVCIFMIENGLIRKIREFWDPIGYEKQLAVL